MMLNHNKCFQNNLQLKKKKKSLTDATLIELLIASSFTALLKGKKGAFSDLLHKVAHSKFFCQQ